jgi:type VI secretion system protein ImpJ
MPKRPKPYWFEGPLVDPRQWQRQDAYHEALLEERIGTISPHAWGLLAIELDEGALRTGSVRFDRLDAVLRDGTIVHVAPDADLLPERALDERLARAESVDVYVTLPQVDPMLPNMDRKIDLNEPRSLEEGPAGSRFRMVPVSTAPGTERVPRYRTRIDQVPDVAEGDPTYGAAWLHNLRIAFGTEPRDRADGVKVAELVRAPSGALMVRELFVPPLLRIGASRFLVAGFRQVLAAMVAKQQALASSRRQRTTSMVEFQAADAARFWLLHTLNGALPSIHDIGLKPDTHPARAHEKLAELIGALCTFDVASDPMQVPLYDHLAPGPAFERMFAMALALLDRLIAERYVQVPLTAQDQDTFAGTFTDATIYRHAFFFAVSGSQMTVRQAWEHVPRLAKVSSLQRITQLKSTASYGAPLEPVHTPPAALPVKSDVAFFRVQTADAHWTEAISLGTVAIHLPIPGAQVALYAVDPQTLQ